MLGKRFKQKEKVRESVFKTKLVAGSYQTSNPSLKVLLGQRRIPLKEVVSKLDREFSDYPADAVVNVRIEQFMDGYSILVMGVTNSWAIKSTLGEGLVRVTERELDKVVDRCIDWVRFTDRQSYRRTLAGTLRSMKVDLVVD